MDFKPICRTRSGWLRLSVFCALAAIPIACNAQHYPQPVYCDSVGCDGCEPTCDAIPRNIPTPRAAPAPPVQMQETGYYQAGPRSGALEGGSRSFGFRGGGITLPTLRLELPSFELPRIVRSSYGARMRVHESHAPWVSTGFRQVGGATVTRAADVAPQDSRATDSQSRSADEDLCEDLRQVYEQKIDELNQKIEACEQLRRSVERTLQDHPLSQQNNLPSDWQRDTHRSNDMVVPSMHTEVPKLVPPPRPPVHVSRVGRSAMTSHAHPNHAVPSGMIRCAPGMIEGPAPEVPTWDGFPRERPAPTSPRLPQASYQADSGVRSAAHLSPAPRPRPRPSRLPQVSGR